MPRPGSLAQLDQDERNWHGRLTEYDNARTRKLSAQQLEQLGRQLFSEQEQLRIEAALAARISQNAATATR